MKRAPWKTAALGLALAIGMAGEAAAATPPPTQGGVGEVLRYVGDPSSATGAALASGPCDVNDDGYDDVVVGAWFWDKAPNNNIGATYVVFGGPDVSSASLADPASAGAVRIDGPADPSAFTGFSVACAGDVDGDGFDDIAISHYTDQRTYVVFGDAEFSGATLDALGDRGFSVVGGPDSGNVGYSIAPVGDIDDDGLADFAVAEVAADTRDRQNNGRVWVIAGRDDISDVDLLAPQPGEVLLTVDGALDQERLGSIASVGDVNGDEVDDFLMGSYTSTPWGERASVPGAAYVVFGGTTGEVDAADLGDEGFAIVGPTRQRDRLGISVAGIGDLNDDGLADLLVGADGVTNATTGPRNGGAAVVFGSASTDTVFTDPSAASGQSVFTCAEEVADPGECTAPGRRGYWIDGEAAGDSLGYSVAGIGDVDGDEVPDLALGAYGYDLVTEEGTLSGAGATYVVFGDPSATVVSLAGLPEADGYRIDGTAAGDRFGRQVAQLGDVDGNGATDLAVGADLAARPDGQQGELTLALMGQLTTSVAIAAPTRAITGGEVVLEAAVAKPAGDQTPLASGTVAFVHAGTTVPGCDAVPVIDGVVTCTTTFADPATGDLVATYSGTDALAPSSATAALEVAPPATADQAWTKAAYEDFLDRAPSATELDATAARLGLGTSRRVVAGELASSEEWIAVSIRRFYQDTLDRDPDASGLAYWVGQVRSGRRTLESVAAQLYSSSEYYRNAGGTDEAWVTDLYDKVLHRAPDAGGLQYWTGQVASRGRASVASRIYASPESRRDRVTALYEALLGRGPDPSGLAYWSERVATTGDLELAVRLVDSGEYIRRAGIRFP